MAPGLFEEIALRFPSCQDVLKGTTLQAASSSAEQRCACLPVPGFLPGPIAVDWHRRFLELLRAHGAPISRPQNTNAVTLPYQYTTAQFIRGPCTCKYDYAGTAKHRVFQYGFGIEDGPSVIAEVDQYFRNTFNLSGPSIPSMWVVNAYTAEKYIDWHTDEAPLFGALDAETEIVSLSLGPDGVFCIQPRTGQSFAAELGLAGKKLTDKIAERGLRHAVKLSEGDFLLMVGSNGSLSTRPYLRPNGLHVGLPLPAHALGSPPKTHHV